MAVNDVFNPTLMADLMAELGHRFSGVGITHEGNALSPLPHWHIPCATRELVHPAPQSRLDGAFALAGQSSAREPVFSVVETLRAL
ncbi:MAG: hypothetical protein EBQ56_04655 [Proteobacteria bacterium]|nr:hypothetical protein [Pseudomonadota bacterium]NCV21123.1 hypothetical protein [Chloroflexota bacterium]HAN15550.1 hypothetical protein [Chloroflexota bacterium]